MPTPHKTIIEKELKRTIQSTWRRQGRSHRVAPRGVFTRTLTAVGLTLLLLFPNAIRAEAPATRPSPAPPLASISADHPRLLVKPGDWPKIRARLQGDELGRQLADFLNTQADSMLTGGFIAPYEPGARDMLSSARQFLRRVTILSVAYRLTDNRAYLERVKQELAAAAALPTWHPEHFLDTAEITMGMALAYDWNYHELSAEERAVVRKALLEKSFAFAQEVYENGVNLTPPNTAFTRNAGGNPWFWAVSKGNWNSVCNSSLLAAALAIAEDEPALAANVVAVAPEYLRRPLTAYGPAGAYPEGPGYWNYGTVFQLIGHAVLESATGTDRGLYAYEPGFAHTVMFELQMFGPSGLMFNFADAKLEWYAGVSPAFAPLGQRFKHPAALSFYRERLLMELKPGPDFKKGDQFVALNALWFPTEVESRGDLSQVPLASHYPGAADVAIFRSAWNDPNALYLAIKAGAADAPHGQLDLGSFVLDADGVRWSSELGADHYQLPGYFDVNGRRQTYLRCNNLGHSTLTIDEALMETTAKAAIENVRGEGQNQGAEITLDRCYPDKASAWKRRFTFERAGRVLVKDDLQGLPPEANVEWRMITEASAEIAPDGKTALLTLRGKKLSAQILSPEHARFIVKSAAPQNPNENPNEGFSIFTAQAKPAADGTLRLSIQLRPVGERWPVDSLESATK
jgi:hypothetical protein